jgi:PKD repeat protein
MIGTKTKTIVVIGLTVLLLGAGVVLGQNTQQATLSPTSPKMSPLNRDWTENFDSYATGSALHGQGGWHAWDNHSINTGYVRDNQSRSPPNSLEVKWTTSTVWVDMVHEFTNVNSGNWTFSAWLYVPSTMTGNSYFILMNNYINGSHTNNADWSLQLEFSATGGTIFDYNNVTKTLPIVKDAWAQIQVKINFDIDQQTIYYNGQFLESTSWKNHVAPGGLQNLACVDLYADSAYSTAVYWDDLSVLPPVPPLSCDAGGPYSGQTGSPVQFSGSATGGTPPYTWAWQFGDGATSTDQNPTHTYSAPGTYQVHLTVTDSAQATASDDATATIVQAPKPNIVIQKITGGRGITVTITNNGNASASMVPWSINLTGGFLLKGKTASGTIPSLAVGQKKNETSKVLGIGKVTITVKAGDKEKTATGFVFLIFVLGVK